MSDQRPVLTELAAGILDQMEPGVCYTRSHLKGPVPISGPDWKRCVSELLDADLIVRVGKKRGTRYQLKDVREEMWGARPLSHPARQVLDKMKRGEKYSRAELLERFEMTVSIWNRTISELLARDLVLREGDRRGARYLLAPPIRQKELFGEFFDDDLLDVADEDDDLDAEDEDDDLDAEDEDDDLGAEDEDDDLGAEDEDDDLGPEDEELEHGEDELDAHDLEGERAVDDDVAQGEADHSQAVIASPAGNAIPEVTRGRFELLGATLSELLRAEGRLVAMVARDRLPPNFWEFCAALANSGGGTLVIGVHQRHNGLFIVKGLHKPELIVEALGKGASDRKNISRVLFSGGDISTQKILKKSIVRVNIKHSPTDRRPVYVGLDSYARHPRKGTFVLGESGMPIKCNAVATDALWGEWCHPYRRAQPILGEENPEPEAAPDTSSSDELFAIAEPAKRHPRLAQGRMKDIVLDLCRRQPLTAEAIAELVDRRASNVVLRYLEPLVQERKLVQRKDAAYELATSEK